MNTFSSIRNKLLPSRASGLFLKKALFKILCWLAYTNFLTGLYAVSMGWFTFQLLKISLVLFNTSSRCCLFLFVVLGYQFYFIITPNPGFASKSRELWFWKNKRVLVWLWGIEFVAFSCTLFFISLSQIFVLSLCAAIGLLYFGVNAFGYLTEYNFRSRMYLKVTSIALVWVLATVVFVLLPIQGLFWISAPPLLAVRFVFIATLCLMFDLRDIEVDTLHDLQTIPSYYGISRTKSIIIGLLGLYTFLGTWFFGSVTSIFLFPTIFLGSILLLHFRKQFSHELYYLVLIDGLMLLPSVYLSI